MKYFRFLSQVMVKISNVEIHTCWGSEQFMEIAFYFGSWSESSGANRGRSGCYLNLSSEQLLNGWIGKCHKRLALSHWNKRPRLVAMLARTRSSWTRLSRTCYFNRRSRRLSASIFIEQSPKISMIQLWCSDVFMKRSCTE